MGYGLTITKRENGERVYVFGGFESQVHYAVKSLSEFAKEYKGQKIKLLCKNQTITCTNASTYALYRYCPYYGKYKNCGYDNVGNKLFVIIFSLQKSVWNKINS